MNLGAAARFWSLAGAAVWVALEMVRARLFGGFPWNFLGASQYRLIPLIQIASVTGVYGVSFLVVWVSLSLFSAVRMIFHRPASRFAWQAETFLPLAVNRGAVCIRFHAHERTKSARRDAAHHAGSAQHSANFDLGPEREHETFPATAALSEQALTLAKQTNEPLSRPADTLSPPGGERAGARGTSKTDLLIWPESAVPEFETMPPITSAITNLVRTHRVWMIFNADDVRAGVPMPDQRMTTMISTPRSCSTRTGDCAAFTTNKSWSSSANTSRSCAGCRS